jgi:hypothetical protein
VIDRSSGCSQNGRDDRGVELALYHVGVKLVGDERSNSFLGVGIELVRDVLGPTLGSRTTACGREAAADSVPALLMDVLIDGVRGHLVVVVCVAGKFPDFLGHLAQQHVLGFPLAL